jgi:transposase-like protein
MTKLKGFKQDFEDEAVRLARTSGRTRRETAENLGVGLSTLTRWMARSRDQRSRFCTADKPGRPVRAIPKPPSTSQNMSCCGDQLNPPRLFSPEREVDEF